MPERQDDLVPSYCVLIAKNVMTKSIDKKKQIQLDYDFEGETPIVKYRAEAQGGYQGKERKGVLKVAPETNAATVTWSNGEVWEPATTPLTDEEQSDRSNYGFDYEKARPKILDLFAKSMIGGKPIIPLTPDPRDRERQISGGE